MQPAWQDLTYMETAVAPSCQVLQLKEALIRIGLFVYESSVAQKGE